MGGAAESPGVNDRPPLAFSVYVRRAGEEPVTVAVCSNPVEAQVVMIAIASAIDACHLPGVEVGFVPLARQPSSPIVLPRGVPDGFVGH